MNAAGYKEQARLRAAVVFAVRSGQITAEEGARRLGVSCKTCYEWEQRALQAMTGALQNRASGRPAAPEDEAKEQLQKEIKELQEKLFVAEKTAEVRDMLHAYELQTAGAKKSASGEKNESKGRSDNPNAYHYRSDQREDHDALPGHCRCFQAAVSEPDPVAQETRGRYAPD